MAYVKVFGVKMDRDIALLLGFLWVGAISAILFCLAHEVVDGAELPNPTAIHYAHLGDWLVDQDGHRTVIHGHPEMVCYGNFPEMHGRFVSAKGAQIILRTAKGDVLIHHPACDVLPEVR